MQTAIAAAMAVVAASVSPAAAQDISGRYRSEGTDPTGITFALTAEIEMLKENACRMTWSDGTGGICLLVGDDLSVAYLVHGAIGLGVYHRAGDGTLEGAFIDDYHGGGIAKGGKVGKEKLTPIRQ
jgi:hypothetical protein